MAASELARRAGPRGVVGRLSPQELTRWLVGGGLATTNGAGVLYPTERAFELGDALTTIGWP